MAQRNTQQDKLDNQQQQKPKRKGEEPLYFLRQSVYPELYEALIQLIDHIIKTDEIRKHQERLKKKKVFDKLEQRKVEKDRLKAELGSDYETSEEESIDFEELGLDKDELDKILAEKMAQKHKEEEEQEDQEQDNAQKKIQIQNKLDKIAEDEEMNDDEDDLDQKKKHKEKLKQQREQDAFNPLAFLSQKIREIHKNKKKI